ncbi:PREDICTED: uncharacterized protein LOC109210816 [Nicotiana attenuata]|uniref:uncharacterized protein LOC109210816 n=1 Tax=Nicotiana attenuata TaxID=49451 RepID=UPI000905C4FF|nr:PREDICTED: uncharacterized protein LOC109210816 [Nicotiana attenuata]
MNEASSSKKVTPVLRYVPKARKVEDPSSELQGKVLGDFTLPIKRNDAIKSSTKLLKGFVKSSSHNSLLNLALPAKHTDEGFDPNAYKLLAKAGYDPNEPSKLGKLPPEASNPTQKMMMEKWYPLKQSREGLGYKQPPSIRISIKRESCNYITAKEVSTMLNKKPSVFDRLTKPRTSVFDRLGPLKKEKSVMETKLVVSCEEVLKAKTHTIVHTKEREEDEESVGSSYHITIHDEQNVSSYAEVEEKCLDIRVCHHIYFNDGDPQEDEDAKDAPPELEEGVKTTVVALKEVNLGVVEDLKPTYVGASLTNDEEGKYIELLKEFKDVFAWSYKEMPCLDHKVVVHHLAVRRSARPVKQAQRRFRPELVPLIETKVNKLIEAGFVREVKYLTWISSIVPVRKKNGQIRVCVDFRDLNNACPKDEFPLPIPELMIDATTGHEAMSFMDGSSGYNQIRMAPKDEELTAFRTPKGIYCYKSRKKDDHLQYLRMVFERLWRYQLRMNLLKCAFGVTSGKFLDFIVRHRGIEIDQAKVDAILKMIESKDIHELKSLQGKLAYLRRFILNLAGRWQPFSRLMKKGIPFEWNQACRNAFESIKTYLMKPPVLAATIPGKPLILYISA